MKIGKRGILYVLSLVCVSRVYPTILCGIRIIELVYNGIYLALYISGILKPLSTRYCIFWFGLANMVSDDSRQLASLLCKIHR